MAATRPADERVSQYARRQWLTEERRRTDIVALAGHLVGIQAQIPTTPAVVAYSRLAAVSPAAVQHELEQTRRLVRTWTVRGTVHVVAAADLPLFWRALQPEWETRWSRYLDNHVTRAQRELVAQAVLSVLAHGPATRSELLSAVQEHLNSREEWVAYLLSSWGGVLKDLAYAGQAVHGVERQGEVKFVLVRDWLGAPTCGLSADAALAELLDRYLEAYSPATLPDFSYWAGVTIRRAQAALRLLSNRVATIDGYLVKPTRRADGEPAPIRLLPKFDPYLLAHSAKYYLGEEMYGEVFRRAADVAAVIVARGQVVGTWRAGGAGPKRRVSVRLLRPLDGALSDQLAGEVRALEAWLSSPM